MSDLTKHEEEVLRIVGGEDVPGWQWGAAMTACLEALKGRGLVQFGANEYQLTEGGRRYLKRAALDWQKEAGGEDG